MDVQKDKIKKVYEQINKHFKTINRDDVIAIVKKLDAIADIYFNEYTLNDKERAQIDSTLLTRKILRNREYPEPNTVNTVLTFICAVYHFKYTYDNYPKDLFKQSNLWDYIICANHEFNFDNKHMWMFSDDDIPETVGWFLNLPYEDIAKYRHYHI